MRYLREPQNLTPIGTIVPKLHDSSVVGLEERPPHELGEARGPRGNKVNSGRTESPGKPGCPQKNSLLYFCSTP